MQAIIQTGGLQFAVKSGEVVRIPKLPADVGQSVNFDKVLLVSGPGVWQIGRPYLPGATVMGEVVGHGRGEKVTVFKFKRRRKYRRTKGHRQPYTDVKITEIKAS